MVARISPTRASACLCSALARSSSAWATMPWLDEALRMRSRLSARELALRLGGGELRPLLPRVEAHQHLARRAPRGPDSKVMRLDDARQVGAHA